VQTLIATTASIAGRLWNFKATHVGRVGHDHTLAARQIGSEIELEIGPFLRPYRTASQYQEQEQDPPKRAPSPLVALAPQGLHSHGARTPLKRIAQHGRLRIAINRVAQLGQGSLSPR
jgi:hypothetical protein